MRIVEKLPRQLKKQPTVCYTHHFISISMLLKTNREIAGHFISFNKRRYLPNPLDAKIYLTYPLGCVVQVDAPHVTSVGEICYIVARAYEKIYGDENKYGVYGHTLESLVIEGMEIHGDATIIVHIGS